MSKVLIIDDDKKHSELLKAYFERHGIKLTCAFDAGAWLGGHHADTDVVVREPGWYARPAT